VTYNSAGQIEACPAVLHDVFGWQRLLFDNASQDDTVETRQYADPPACVGKEFQTFGVHATPKQAALRHLAGCQLFVNPDAIAKGPGARIMPGLSSPLPHTGAEVDADMLVAAPENRPRAAAMKRICSHI
jgi:hypothetical protein